MKFLTTTLCLLIGMGTFAQVERTPASSRLEAAQQRQQLIQSSHLNGIAWRSVGPTVMSGRVVDIAVNPADHTHFFVAYASGGLWETRNNGQSFDPLFDHEAVMTIGAIAVHWPDTSIWIGTGEVNSSRSSYSGLGMYYSPDQGRSWLHKGLAESHHIGKVIVHPQDPKTVYVAALGPLYTDGGQRGVFMSSDGGTQWEHVLDTGAGAVDLAIHPDSPGTLYASLWDRERKAWDFRGHGPKSGVYMSEDEGKTWEHITKAASGFPQGDFLGRIGIDVTVDDGNAVLYAIHDNQDRRPKETEVEEASGLDRTLFKDMSKEQFLVLDEQEVSTFLKSNGFPEEYSYTYIADKISVGEIEPRALYDYLTDANTALFDTPVIGAEVFRYDTEQAQWSKTHEGYLDDVVYSYGYYFGMIHVQPGDAQRLYIGGVPLLYSDDGGATWENINPENVHADHHALWLDPKRPGHLINGNDGGINISYDNGAHYANCNSPAVGQFYTVQVDNAEPYNIYGGLQDNGVWKGPSDYEDSPQWHQTGRYPYEMLLGGDGMQIEVDPRDNETVYTGYQFGHYYRLHEDKAPHYFHPSHELGERPLRWNWQTPIHLSSHHPDILYMGSDKLHRSMDQGNTWEAISPDLTHGGKEGNVPFGTLTSIDESPLQFGLLIAGSDDGRVHLSSDGGLSWEDISQGLEPGLWVSRVRASAHDEDRLYVSLNGYRNDHSGAYIYRSDDRGKSWQRLGKDMTQEAVNVILEDPKHEELLYVGTDHGLYVSMDSGHSFQAMMHEFPHVAVHDMVIQQRESELVVGTHGRSIYVADISPLHAILGSEGKPMLIIPDSLHGAEHWGQAYWSKWFGIEEPELDIVYHETSEANCALTVYSSKRSILHLTALEPGQGIQRYAYDLSIDPSAMNRFEKELKKADKFPPEQSSNGKYYLPPGTYTIRLGCGTAIDEQSLIID